ncbi:MAG: SDR family NAD(P)-dependent oxidoreductase, partial [Bacteroidia bacterium]|nr:SDR family NAD(P)-dependent oxidoreductase [Bacteroidia bacterium]
MKNILITGVSSGIGFHLVKTFSNLPGYNIIGFSRNKNKLKQLKSGIKSSNGSNLYLESIDINKLTSKKLQQIFAKHKIKKLDVLINNAGLLINKPFLKLKPADWQSIYNTNVFSQVALIQYCYALLKKSKNAHIVNISSLGGIPVTDKFPGLSAY